MKQKTHVETVAELAAEDFLRSRYAAYDEKKSTHIAFKNIFVQAYLLGREDQKFSNMVEEQIKEKK